jgi:hypothetical protein
LLRIELLEDRCVPSTVTPTTFADGGPGSSSLRDAVLQFNADAGSDDDMIQLQAGTYALTIQNVAGRHETAGLTGDLNLTQTSHHWIIQGAGSSGDNPTVIDASQLQDRVLQIVTPGTQVVFRDLVIRGGLAQDDGSDGALAGTTDALGGGILNNGGDVTLDNVVLQNNVARGADAAVLSAPGHNARGGGFYSTGGALTIAGATLANNQVIGGRGGDSSQAYHRAGDGGSATGGGLYTTGGSLDISDSMVASNRATGGRGGDGELSGSTCVGDGGAGGTAQGGGLYVNGSSLTIATSTMASNQGTGGFHGLCAAYNAGGVGQGGGLYNAGTLTVTSSTLSGNSAASVFYSYSGGGGISNYGTLTVSNSTLSGNTAANGGGGIDNHSGTLMVSNSTLSGNSAPGYGGGGGGINNPSGTLIVSNSTLSGNSASGSGGGILISFGTLTVSNSTLSGNSTGFGGNGGGIYNGGTLTIGNSTLSGNSTGGNGGGIDNAYGTLTLSNSTLSGNSASIGGGIYNYHNSTLTVSNSTLSGNTATNYGGGIYNQGTLTVSNSTLSGNSAGTYGGGILTNSMNPVTLTNVTLTANRATSYGGGLDVAVGSPALHNTLIAGNFLGASRSTPDDVHGSLNPGGDYNLIGDGTGLTGLSNGVNGNLVGSAAAPIDPLLGPLAANGGPTLTHALLPGSPAIDAGNNAYATDWDQRGPGFPRVLYGTIDIGALELGRGLVLTVTSTLDEHSDGLLSLREALDQANTDARHGQSDTIRFDPSLGNATITLSAGPLELSGASATATETIDGGGRVTVSGHDASQVFQIDTGVRAELDGLTITHGSATVGGGIANSGTLTVSNSILSGNIASEVGGGIYNQGTLTVSNSTLSGNSATSGYDSGRGGGIYNLGTLTVSNSTLSGNSAFEGGGAVWTGPALGPCTLTNVTVSANRANTGGLGGYGGGVFVDPAAALRPLLHNTLSAGNFNGATGTSRDDVRGALDPGGDDNLIGDGTGLTGLRDGVNGNLVGSAAAPIDSLLGPLQDNAGPTPTMALLPGSPAVDAGNNAYATRFDQRGPGFPRVRNGRIDIGAFELAPALLRVTSTLDEHSDGLLSLREALDEANTDARHGQSDTIRFDPSLGNATITLSADPLELSGASATATETIDGGGRVTVSGHDASQVFQIDTGVRAELDGLTITHGSATVGGGIANHGTLTVSNSTLSANSATDGGGGIYNLGTLTVSNSTLSGNTGRGGGIYNSVGTLTVSNSNLSGNSASIGGGIYNGGTLTVSNSTLSGNTATANNGGGGGISNYGTLTVSNSTLSGNTATGYNGSGGGIYNHGTLTVTGSTLSSNSANENGYPTGGGGISNYGTLTLSNSTLSGNTASGYNGRGGGIYNSVGALTVSNSTLSGNSAGIDGGGIYNYSGTHVTLTNVTLTANRANTGGRTAQGGGLYIDSSSPLLHNTLIAGNFRGATGTTRDDVLGALDPGGDYNLIGDGTGMTGLQNGVNGNLVGSAAAPIDPLLGPLAGNGGPTLTHALLSGSPAIDAGNNDYATDWDQRGPGYPRIVNGIIDIGAFEAQIGNAVAFPVDAPARVTAGAPVAVTVTVLANYGQVAAGYPGTGTFATSDPHPGVVWPADYTFGAADGGVHTFTDTGLGETTLVPPGDQTRSVTDTAANTLSGSRRVTVSGPAPWPGRHGLGQPPNSFPASTGQAQAPTRSAPSAHEVAAVDRWFAAVPAGDEAGPTWSWVQHPARREADAWRSDLFGTADLLLVGPV